MKEDTYTAYFSMGLAGYELRVDDAGDNVFYRFFGTDAQHREQRAKVRFTAKGHPFFLANGRRIHLDECLRKNI